MVENSKIEWTTHTFNPWIGCQEVSAACDNCYARVQNNFRGWVKGWGPHGERKRTSVSNWRKPIAWNRAAEGLAERPRVFCASLADVFDNQASNEWRRDLWQLIAATPNLDWLLLTKRPENAARMVPGQWASSWPANIWLGTTTENQLEYERRRQHIFDLPAAKRFFSVEPMLGPLLLDGHDVGDWYICGGESAKGTHRPMDLAWARNLRDQCRYTGAAFFMKQIDKIQPIPDDLMIREFPR